MTRSVLRRLLAGLAALAAANLLGFSYAHLARCLQALQNPFGARPLAPDLPALYAAYLQDLARLDLGRFGGGAGQSIAAALAAAASASAGLLAPAAALSLLAGLALGLAAVRVDPPGLAGWSTPAWSLGLAMPGFYLGTLLLAAAVLWLAASGAGFPLPLSGFGLDAHLILPAAALALRPAAQIAQVTARLLADEIGRPYVVTARSVGYTWGRIRWRHALRAIWAPLLLAGAGALRVTLGELVLVEWAFAWPGIGRLLAQTLLAPNIAAPGGFSGGGAYFLQPALLAALLTAFALAFLVIDGLASALARAADPRGRPEAGP